MRRIGVNRFLFAAEIIKRRAGMFLCFQAPDQIPHMVNEEESDRNFGGCFPGYGRSSGCEQNGWATVPDKNAALAVEQMKHASSVTSLCFEKRKKLCAES